MRAMFSLHYPHGDAPHPISSAASRLRVRQQKYVGGSGIHPSVDWLCRFHTCQMRLASSFRGNILVGNLIPIVLMEP